jgi:hypothetical protein
MQCPALPNNNNQQTLTRMKTPLKNSFTGIYLVIVTMLFVSVNAHAGWAWPWTAGKLAEQAAANQAAAEHAHSVLIAFFIIGVLGFCGCGAVIRHLYKNQTVVQKVVKQEVVNKVVQEVHVIRTPAHDLTTDKLVVDGLNVIYGYGSNQKPNLLNLLALLTELQKGGYNFKCYFDPGTYYTLSRANKKHAVAYRHLVRDYPQCFIEVPVHNKADGFILDYAHNQGAAIISNDRFRDYEEKYSWIATDAKRRVAFINDTTMLQVLPLGIQAAISSELENAVKSLRMGFGEKFPSTTEPAQEAHRNGSFQQVFARA